MVIPTWADSQPENIFFLHWSAGYLVDKCFENELGSSGHNNLLVYWYSSVGLMCNILVSLFRYIKWGRHITNILLIYSFGCVGVFTGKFNVCTGLSLAAVPHWLLHCHTRISTVSFSGHIICTIFNVWKEYLLILPFRIAVFHLIVLHI